MRRMLCSGITAGLLLVILAGCGGQTGTGPDPGNQVSAPDSSAPAASGEQALNPNTPSGIPGEAGSNEISREDALAIALDNAGVAEDGAYNIKNERDGDSGIPIYDIEFETDYGDYDFEVAMADGRIVGADYEVDEEWLDTLGDSPVSLEEAALLVQSKVPGSHAEDIEIREESGDGRDRYEGELFFDGMKYEFEIDPRTGIIFDWNADLRS